MDSRLLAEVTTSAVEALADSSPAPHRVLWALGSLEQHGPHLPLATDAIIAEAVSREVRKELNAAQPESGVWWQLPTLGLSTSGEHEGFPGTVSIGTEALVQVILEVGRSAAAWSNRLVIVSGHGGNAEALTRAVGILRSEDKDASWLECRPGDASTDLHAGHTETSLLLHLRPELVADPPYPEGNRQSVTEVLPALREHGIYAVSPNGVLGDARDATAERGAEYFLAMVTDALERVSRYDVDPDGRLRPN
jgi:mycofactocin system creatininase family protein